MLGELKEKLLILGILVITFIVFSPSLFSDFTNLDDNIHLLENPQVVSLDFSHLKSIFSSPIPQMHLYVPLTILSFSLEHHFWGYNPFIYHLNNLILHAAAVFMIFLFAAKMGLTTRASVLAAGLFSIHPMHVESVAWITERKDVLYALFYMLALNYYLIYLNSQNKLYYLLTLFMGLISLLAKPMAFSLPLILLVIDWTHNRKLTLRNFYNKIPFMVYVIPIIWLTASPYIRNPIHNLWESFLIWSWTFVFYIRKFFFPISLNPFYQLPQPVKVMNPEYLVSALLLITLIFLLIRLRKNSWFLFAWLYYFLSIFILLRFDDVTKFSGNMSVVADRFMYLPSLGFCLLIGKYGDEILNKMKKIKLVYYRIFINTLMMEYLLLAIMTFKQCEVWVDSVSLWTKVIEDNPHFARGYSDRCDAYLVKKEFDLALRDCDKAIALDPHSLSKPYHNRAIIYEQGKRYELALNDMNKAIEINPSNYLSYFNRGNLYLSWHQYDLAIVDFTKSLAMKSDSVETYNNRGNAYRAIGKYDLALKDFNAAITINPGSGRIYYNRSLIYALKIDYASALNDARKAHSLGYTGLEKYLSQLENLIKN